MEELKPLGEAFTKAMITGYAFLAALILSVLLAAVLIAIYRKMKRESIETGEKKDLVPLRIGIYAACGAAAFLILTAAVGALL
ncbi:MAG: hypothetical protein IJ071_13290 [Ruminococcus sp.]|nr:hypothetical protein [Ruminococcus sp.]